MFGETTAGDPAAGKTRAGAHGGRWLGDGDEELSPSDRLDDALEVIARFHPLDPAQEVALERTQSFCASHPDALHRTCEEGHLTASALVIDHSGEHAMLLFHSKVRRWLQPGGHADGDASLAAVALKEVAEETGLTGLTVWSEPVDIDVHLFVNRKQTEPDHFHHDVRFLVRAGAGADAVGNHESEALRWVAPDDLASAELELDESTLRLARHGFSLARRLGVSAAG